MSGKTARRARRAADADLDAVYALVPQLECKGLCHESCHAPIRFGPAEAERMRRAHGGELPRSDRTDGMPACPLLTADNRCSVYAARPLVCRLHGTIDAMPCEHGCEPSRLLTITEARVLLARVGSRGVHAGETMHLAWWNDPVNRRRAGSGHVVAPPAVTG